MPIPVKSLSLKATVTVTPLPVVLSASAYINPDITPLEPGLVEPGAVEETAPAWELKDNTWSVDAEGSTAALARGIIQESRIEVWVDGTQVPMSELINGIRVTRTRDRAIQDWSFETAVNPDTGMGPFGNPIGQLGAPLGKRDVTLYAAYKTSTGAIYRYPLITNGRVDNYIGPSDGTEHTEQHSGVDALGCLSRSLVDYVKAPGQRIRRDVAIREMFTQAGATSFNVSPMRPTNKPLQWVEADPVQAAQELCEVEGRQIQASPYGEIRNPKLRGSGTPQWTIRESDLLSFQLNAPGDVITRVTVNGTEWVAGEGEEGCAAQTTEFRQSTDTIYAPKRVRWQQEANCIITDLGSSTKDPALIQTRLVVTKQVKRCGILVAEIVEVWEWHARETWRYQRDSADFATLECRPSAMFLEEESAPTLNGSEPAVAESEVWRLVKRTETDHFYDLPGWQGNFGFLFPRMGADLVLLDHLNGVVSTEFGDQTAPVPSVDTYTWSQANGYIGSYLGSITVESAFYSPRAALKDNFQQSLTWDERDYLINVRVLGSGDAALSGGSGGGSTAIEVFTPVRGEAHIVHANGLRQIEREVVHKMAYHALRGTKYLYGDGSTRSELVEVPHHVSIEETSYQGEEESRHSAVLSKTDLTDRSNDSVVSEDRDGARPQVDILPFIDEEVVTEIEANGGNSVNVSTIEAAMARHHTQDENRQFSVPVTSDQLENRHCVRHLPTSNALLEDEEEAEEYGKMLIDESSALVVSVEILLNGLMDETDAAFLYYGPRGINGRRLEFRSLTHSHSAPREMPTTTIDGRIYLATN